MSIKQFFENAKGKPVTKTVTGVNTIEDWPEMVENITKSLIEQGCKQEDIKVTDDMIQLKNGQFFRKPAFRAMEKGTITERSKDYYFVSESRPDKQYGEKKGAKVSPDNMTMVKEYDYGATITFTIQD